ncbi:MAG: hypothetical protein EB117_17535 [Betaproteobacteria bacterium]|nr:hypothetical protein [Betaproteobacteria bacterium]
MRLILTVKLFRLVLTDMMILPYLVMKRRKGYISLGIRLVKIGPKKVLKQPDFGLDGCYGINLQLKHLLKIYKIGLMLKL